MRRILAALVIVTLALSIHIPVVSAQSQPSEVATIPPKPSLAVELWVDSDTSLWQPLSSWGSRGGSLQADLTLSTGDIEFDPSAPAEGDTITIKATIHNDGTRSAMNVVVRFSTDGTPIGDQTIRWLSRGSTRTASIEWGPVAAGTHTITVEVDPENNIAESNEGNNFASREITVAGGAPATIGYSPSSFSFTATEGGANPGDQTLEVWNSGGGTLSWSVSNDATWLTLSPTSGSSTGETDNVIASVDISGMSAGSYSATITIPASGATNSPQTVPVSLTINPAVQTEENKWAVIIGIADYMGTSNDLYHPDDDAREMYAVLTEIYGFPESHITMLIDSEATLANIKAAIAWLEQNEDSESTVVFFYCGHGYQQREWDWRWRNADGDIEADRMDEFIVSYDLYAYADGYLRNDFAKFESNKIMLWFGSCYSGGMNDIAAAGRVITAACGENQYGYDISLDTPVAGIPWAGNTLFGYYYVDEGMLQGLADGTLTADGMVTVEEAFWYAKPLVEAWAESVGLVSGPVIFDNYPGEFYL